MGLKRFCSMNSIFTFIHRLLGQKTLPQQLNLSIFESPPQTTTAKDVTEKKPKRTHNLLSRGINYEQRIWIYSGKTGQKFPDLGQLSNGTM